MNDDTLILQSRDSHIEHTGTLTTYIHLWAYKARRSVSFALFIWLDLVSAQGYPLFSLRLALVQLHHMHTLLEDFEEFEDTLELAVWRSAWHTIVFGLFDLVLAGTLHLFGILRLAGWLARL